MKKLLCLGLAVAAITFGSFRAYRKYRISPLDEGPRRPAVLGAATAECAKNWEWYRDEVIVPQANPDFLTIKLNEENITVELLRDTLPQALGVRMDRSLFLVDNSAGDHNASLVLEKELEHLPGVDRICIIDPKHPPTWYPPSYPDVLSGGGRIALRAG